MHEYLKAQGGVMVPLTGAELAIGLGFALGMAVIGLLSFLLRMIFTGRLMPRHTHNDCVTRHSHDEVTADRDLWRRVALQARGQGGTLLDMAQKVVDAPRVGGQ